MAVMCVGDLAICIVLLEGWTKEGVKLGVSQILGASFFERIKVETLGSLSK